MEITQLDGTDLRNNHEDTLSNNGLNFFRNSEYFINGKYIENIDYVVKTTTVKIFLDFI